MFALSSCANMEVADIRPIITLPASKNCFAKNVISLKEAIIPRAECDEMKKRGIFLTREDWKKQKVSILKNCQLKKCKQIVGVFDDLFITIDAALDKI